jgi:hypothetical protein
MVRKCAAAGPERKKEREGGGRRRRRRRGRERRCIPHFAILFSRRRMRRIAVEARFAVGFARIVKGYA